MEQSGLKAGEEAEVVSEVIQAVVLEVKGDWKQMHFCFGVPGWMSSPQKPICFKDEAGFEAGWLQPEGRLTHLQALDRLLESGGSLSPVWSMPFLTMESLRLDWLHVADQGLGLDGKRILAP